MNSQPLVRSMVLRSVLIASLKICLVLPLWRGRGGTNRLIDAAISWAKTKGCHDMEVVLTRESQQDTHFLYWYENRRYVETGRTILTRKLKA